MGEDYVNSACPGARPSFELSPPEPWDSCGWRGELLNFHPHVHVHVTDGGFLSDGTFRPLAWFDSQHVERLFRANVLRMLLEKELGG